MAFTALLFTLLIPNVIGHGAVTSFGGQLSRDMPAEHGLFRTDTNTTNTGNRCVQTGTEPERIANWCYTSDMWTDGNCLKMSSENVTIDDGHCMGQIPGSFVNPRRGALTGNWGTPDYSTIGERVNKVFTPGQNIDVKIALTIYHSGSHTFDMKFQSEAQFNKSKSVHPLCPFSQPFVEGASSELPKQLTADDPFSLCIITNTTRVPQAKKEWQRAALRLMKPVNMGGNEDATYYQYTNASIPYAETNFGAGGHWINKKFVQCGRLNKTIPDVKETACYEHWGVNLNFTLPGKGNTSSTVPFEDGHILFKWVWFNGLNMTTAAVQHDGNNELWINCMDSFMITKTSGHEIPKPTKPTCVAPPPTFKCNTTADCKSHYNVTDTSTVTCEKSVCNIRKNCHAISPSTTHKWCMSNCNNAPAYCPSNLCNCGGKAPPGPAPAPPGPKPAPQGHCDNTMEVAPYAQCSGGDMGEKQCKCPQGQYCIRQDEWYSQCKPAPPAPGPGPGAKGSCTGIPPKPWASCAAAQFQNKAQCESVSLCIWNEPKLDAPILLV